MKQQFGEDTESNSVVSGKQTNKKTKNLFFYSQIFKECLDVWFKVVLPCVNTVKTVFTYRWTSRVVTVVGLFH